MKSRAIQLGDLTVAPQTRELTDRHGNPVQLRHKSREVLRALIENAGQTVSKSDIMDTVWTDVTVSDESLVQCIADIRRVIGKDARQIIETVPREGYRLNIPSSDSKPPAHPATMLVPVTLLGLAVGAALALTPRLQNSPPATTATQARATPPGTDVTEAYLEVLQGRVSAERFSKDESLIAERHYRRAIDLDPTYARAYAELGTLFAIRFENGWVVPFLPDKEKALTYAQKAVDLDPDLWLAHYALGRLQSVLGNLDIAETHLETAMSLKPDSEDARAYYGVVKTFLGESESAVAILEPALASHPNPPYWYHLAIGNALYNVEDYDRAAASLNRCLALAKASPYCLRYLIAVYGELGDTDAAAKAARTYAEAGYEPSVSAMMALMPFHNPKDRARLEASFRRAGLPE